MDPSRPILPREAACKPIMDARRAAAEQRVVAEEQTAGLAPADPPARRPLAMLPAPLLLLAVGAALLAQVGCRGPVAVYGGPPIPAPRTVTPVPRVSSPPTRAPGPSAHPPPPSTAP